jgi:pimeloyl-ACP methyl ester carboxylesterase
VGATRRKPSFASPREALENFGSKTAFASWDERALAGYVEGGLIERDGRFWLACDPQVEADAYRAGAAHGTYERLSEIRCPVLILAGGSSETHPEAFAAHLADLLPEGRYQIIPGAGHFLPMERPDLIARHITDEFRRFAPD